LAQQSSPTHGKSLALDADKSRDAENLKYDAKRGVTRQDMERRARLLQENPKGKWQQGSRFWEDLPSNVSEMLERCFIAGELKCGVWDNGLFRDFDLAKMSEIPGLKGLRRVGINEK